MIKTYWLVAATVKNNTIEFRRQEVEGRRQEAGGRRQEAGGRRNPPLLIVGLILDALYNASARLGIILSLNWALNPATLVLIDTHNLLPPAFL
ncbi:hypothetical protein [Nostoc sp. 'Peltigera membranacea cyanobiont' 210A]|uniref:hypothetical protein n=1 Tax=Nostoc sp. 'Peltigera membranacea cyanobiont' 210A TaxID=2014529 RepID=UPI00117EB5F7|nr:hypothetical protein [Nostoc sp. 'Peltigera membranacea cyanobiont' 210A]